MPSRLRPAGLTRRTRTLRLHRRYPPPHLHEPPRHPARRIQYLSAVYREGELTADPGHCVAAHSGRPLSG
jgi:hypothetical protein